MRPTLLPIAFFLPALSLAAPPPVAEKLLPDGLTVLVAENHAQPLITVEIGVKNGSMTEPKEYNGLSHLYEHMFFKANKVIPSQEAYLARARELGMLWDGTTNTERVNYFFTTTTPHFADAMAFMRDAIVSPLFGEKEFEKERVVVTGEIDRNESNPQYYLWHETEKKVWWKYPSRKDPLGARASVLAATTDMMRTIQKRYYVPNNSVLVVTGDVSAPEVFTMAGKLYAGWERAEDPFVEYPLVTHPPIPKTEVVLVEQPVKTVTGLMTWHGPSTVGPETELTYPADLLGYAVQQPSSKFQKALVDSGACLGASLSWLTQRNVGPITLSFETTPERADACTKAALAELPKMRQPDYLSDEEMADAALAVEMDFARQREKPSEYAHTLTFWWASAGLDYYRGYVDNVRKATREQIARYVDTYLLGKPFVFGVMVSPEMVKGGLDQAHFESLAAAAPAAGSSRAPAGTAGDVTEYGLDGMQILVKRIPGAELFAAQLYVRGGVRNWSKEEAGVEKLALRAASTGGTTRLDKDAFARRLEEMGSTLEATSTNDWAVLSAKGLKRNFAGTFDLLAEAFLSPALPESEITLVRDRMLAGLKREQENPDGALSLLAERTLFSGHPYERRAAGTIETVGKLTREAAATHISKLREKGRLLLVVAGDVEPQAVYEKARGAFGSLPKGIYREEPLSPLSFGKPRVDAEERKLPTNYIKASFPVPSWRDPDYAAARVAMSLLSYREFQEVRTRRNLSYAPYAALNSAGVSQGFLYVTAVDPMATMKVMLGEVRRLQREPVPEKELAGTKEEFISSFLARNETTDGQASFLASAQLLAGDFREAGRLVDRVRAVTPANVQAFAREYIRNLRTAYLGDPPKFAGGLSLLP